jgi:hypothetical protein
MAEVLAPEELKQLVSMEAEKVAVKYAVAPEARSRLHPTSSLA